MGKWRQALTFHDPRRSLAEKKQEEKFALAESIEAEGTVTYRVLKNERFQKCGSCILFLVSLSVKVFHCWNCAFCTLKNPGLLSLLTTDHSCQRQDGQLIKCHAAALVTTLGIKAWGPLRLGEPPWPVRTAQIMSEWSCWEGAGKVRGWAGSLQPWESCGEGRMAYLAHLASCKGIN